MEAGHFFILCCFGGLPYIEFEQASTKEKMSVESSSRLHPLDPTDWIAKDESGDLLNSTLHPDLLLSSRKNLADLIPSNRPPQFSLEQCDLFNLTFTSSADEHTFLAAGGRLMCRCPISRVGNSCQFSSNKEPVQYSSEIITHPSTINVPAVVMDLTSENVTQSSPTDFRGQHKGSSSTVDMALLILFMFLMALVFMMLRYCCLCDCFGGCRKRKRDSEPLDPEAVNRCVERLRAHEETQKGRHAVASSSAADHRRPLISSVTATCPPMTVAPAVGYTVVPPPAAAVAYSHHHRSPSPPPSYHSTDGV